jgi:hypothetical protein
VKDIRQKLNEKSKEWLVDRLMELAVADDANNDRIILSLVAEDEDNVGFVAMFRCQLDKAAAEIVSHGSGNSKSQIPTRGFDAVADVLAVGLSPKNLNAVTEISEYALIKLDSVFELQDECELEYLVDAFRHLHLEASYRLRPEPKTLGMRLAELSRQTQWGFFDGPPEGYTEVLGKEGLSAFLSTQEVS